MAGADDVTLIGSNCPASRVGRCVDCEGGRTAQIFSDCAITKYLSRVTARQPFDRQTIAAVESLHSCYCLVASTYSTMDHGLQRNRPPADRRLAGRPVSRHMQRRHHHHHHHPRISSRRKSWDKTSGPSFEFCLSTVKHFRIISYHIAIFCVISYRIVSCPLWLYRAITIQQWTQLEDFDCSQQVCFTSWCRLSLKVPPTHRPYPLPTHRLLTNDPWAAPPAAPTQSHQLLTQYINTFEAIN